MNENYFHNKVYTFVVHNNCTTKTHILGVRPIHVGLCAQQLHNQNTHGWIGCAIVMHTCLGCVIVVHMSVVQVTLPKANLVY